MICELDTHKLAYEVSGSPGGLPVLFGHCFAADHHFFDGQLPILTKYQTVQYDTRSHGESDTPPGPCTLDDLGNDVIGLLDHLQINQAHYVGVSMGGMIGQNVALRFPERLLSLSLVNTISSYEESGRQVWRDWVRKVRQSGVVSLHAELLARWFTDEALNQEIPGSVYMKGILKSFSDASFEYIANAIIKDLHYSDRIKDIKIPTLIVASPDDPGIPRHASQLLNDKISGSQIEWLSPAHHLATLEHETAFNEILSKFLDAQSSN